MRRALGGLGVVAVIALLPGGCGSTGDAPPGTTGDTNDPTPPCEVPGTICAWAGDGDPAFTGDGLPALQTALYWPVDVEFAPGADGDGYILDWQNHRVRRVERDGTVHTVIGTDEIGDGPAPGAGDELTPPGVAGTAVNLNHPTDLQFGPDGQVVLAAWHNHKLRRYDLGSELIEVECGRGPGFAGDGGPAEDALLNMPKAIALAPSGDLFVVDTRNFRIRRIAADTGMIETVAGTGTRGSDGDGGDPLAARFAFQKGLDQTGADTGENPEPGGGLTIDAQGRLLVADTENSRIRRIDLVARTVETIAGTGVAGFSGDGGPATEAQLNFPRDLELSPDGRLFIADSDNHRVRVVDLTTGVIDTVAGVGTVGDTGDGGPARAAELHRPFGVGFDGHGDLYIADTLNNRVRKVAQP